MDQSTQSIPQYPTREEHQEKVKQEILAAGKVPIQAIYDAGKNCLLCGEAGRCPGWHTKDEMKKLIW
jgi:hypothetical protein